MKKTYLFLIIPVMIIGLAGCSNKNLASNNSNNSQNIDTANNQTQATSQLPVVNNQVKENNTAPIKNTSTPIVNTPKTVGLTLTEITKHNSTSDCWMAVNGNVYNLSSYIKAGLHPGGDKINNGCGKDASVMFQMVGKHNGKNVSSTLGNYLLGALQK